MSTTPSPLFDMSKAQPIQQAAPPAPLFDMSKAQPIGQDADAAHAERAARSREGVDMSGGKDSTAMGMLVGAGKEADRTVSGAATLVNEGINKVLPSGAQLPLPQKVPPTNGAAESVGGGLENLVEFAGGDEALKGLKSFVQTPTAVMELMEKYPRAAKLITGMAKSGIVGAAQGGVKGASDGKAAEGALEGGAGAAAGSGVVDAAAEGLKPLAKILGVGGLSAEEALTKAGRPSVSENYGGKWQKSLQTALPAIKDFDPKNVRNVGDFEDMLHDAADNVRGKFNQAIKDNGKEIVSGHSVADNIEKAVTPQMEEYAPEQADEIKDFATKFRKDMPLAKAEKDLQYFNAELRKFYKLGPQDAAGSLKTNGAIAKYEAAADGLRDVIYGKLKDAGVPVPEELQQQYGALKDLERTFGKRATVADRAEPLNLSQKLAAAGGITEGLAALAAGHPAAATMGAAPFAVATAAKMRNAPESLIRQGINAAKPATNVALKAGAKKVAETVAGSAGEQFHDWVTVIGPDGQKYQVHPDDYKAALDKGAKPVNPNSGTPTAAVPSDYQKSGEFVARPEDIETFKTWTPTGPKSAAGMVSPGNIDLTKRPIVHHPDGSVSSLYSGSFSTDKGEVLVPFVSPAGKMMSEKEAMEHYEKTGQMLGIFKTPDAADKYAEMLHLKQGAFQTWKNGGKYNPSVETYDNWTDKH